MQNLKHRLAYIIATGFAMAFLFKFFIFKNSHHYFNDEILFVTIITTLICEGNLRIDFILNQKYSWIKYAKKRLLLQFTLSLCYTIFTLIICILIINYFKFGSLEVFNPKMKQVFFPTIMITFIVLSIEIGNQFLQSWKLSLIEFERYKTETAHAQLQNLKNQLNPHFLFNNLSVLTSLIYKNQDKAADFINELSKVYRYVLDTKNSELVTLHQELDFINHYIYLQKIRFEDSFLFEINVEESKKNDFLLPMCLQMVVENTIQHNETSQTNPLKVKIYTQNNALIIENPIKPRKEIVNSSKTGLKNIQKRYSFFTDEKVIIENNGTVFRVILPLIPKK